MRPAQQDREDVAAERAAFRALQPSLDPSRLIFVDESGIRQGMRTAYGYAPRGERCSEAAPFRVGRRLGLIGWIGLRGGSVVPLEGSVTAGVFERFVAHYLVPSLQAGDIVIWDNARVHSKEAVRLVEQAGATVLAQPRYSPEVNAAEPLWSKVKGYVGRALADTAEALEAALGEAVATVRESDVRGWLQHCGYACQPT
jgi:transposase